MIYIDPIARLHLHLQGGIHQIIYQEKTGRYRGNLPRERKHT